MVNFLKPKKPLSRAERRRLRRLEKTELKKMASKLPKSFGVMKTK